MFDKLEVKEWLEYNAKLQKKKNALRKLLKEKGILKKGGNNDFDNYQYFSEAQYKELFTELFSACDLELKFDELEYETFEGTEKQANGRMPKLLFRLFDCETGFYEDTHITGEGIDKGDKAGYKAYTGALKYYLADTFMVATGDDPEKESPDNKMNTKKGKTTTKATTGGKISIKQKEILLKTYTGDNLTKLLEVNGIKTIDELPVEKASELISKIFEKKEQKANE